MRYVLSGALCMGGNSWAVWWATDSFAWWLVAISFWAALLLASAVAIEQFFYRQREVFNTGDKPE